MKTSITLLAAGLLLAPGAAGAQDLPESSPQALMHHAQGVAAYVQSQYVDAIAHFLAAHQSDPTSYVSLFMAGLSAGNAGQGPRADSLYALVAPHKDKLSPYYRYRLEAQMAGRAGNVQGYIEANRKAAALGPGTKAWYNVAQGLVPRGHAREGREALRQLDPDREPMKGWRSYYDVYSNAAHQLGDFEDELRMMRRAKAQLPGDIVFLAREAEALAALGRTNEAEHVLDEIRHARPRGSFTPGEAMIDVALEFGAHGDAVAARRWLEEALKWSDALPAGDARTAANRSDRGYTLYAMERFGEARSVYQALAAEFPDNATWKAWLGLLDALTGQRAAAMDVASRIESGEIRFTPANSAIWRALIALALDDRATALSLLEQSGLRLRWMHRDPVILKRLGGDPQWVAYLKAGG